MVIYAIKITDIPGPWQRFSTIGDLLNTLLPNVLTLAGIVLFILIIGSGIMVIRGGGEAEQMEKAKKAITAAVIGFLLIFTAYWLVKIIEFITGVSILP